MQYKLVTYYDGLHSTSLLLLGWSLQHTSIERPRLLTTLTTAAI